MALPGWVGEVAARVVVGAVDSASAREGIGARPCPVVLSPLIELAGWIEGRDRDR